MKHFSYTTTLEFTHFTYSQMSIPVDVQEELQSIIGIIGTFEEHPITLKVGNEELNAHFRRYEQGQLKLHFGRGFKDAFSQINDDCRGLRLEYLHDDCFKLIAIDNLDEKIVEAHEALPNQVHINDDGFGEFLFELEKQFRRNITQFAGNEYNVRTLLIEPILDWLGWTAPLYRHSEVVCKREVNSGRADFTLDKNGICMIVIEAKSIDAKLDGQEEQLREYINRTPKFNANAVAGILTNGYEWRIYKYKNNNLNCIIRTDISRHEDFNVIRGLFHKDLFDADRISDYSNCINYPCERFYEPASRAKLKIVCDNGKTIEGKDNTERLKNFIIRFEDSVIEMSKYGCFDKIIITDENDCFQRTLGTQFIQKDHGNYYITKDHGTTFKYLIIKQIIYCLGLEEKGWKVEYE